MVSQLNWKNISIFQKQDKNPLVQNGCAENKYNYRKVLDITSIHVTNLFFNKTCNSVFIQFFLL